jgi:hypothetical protein
MAPHTGTLWDGLALWRTRAAPEPDAAPRAIALPQALDQDAAEALAALAPGQGAVVWPRLVESWLQPLLARGRSLRLLADAREADWFAESTRHALLARAAAPGIGLWRGDARAPARFVLNLAAFLDEDGGFDAPRYAATVALGVRILDIWTGARAPRLALGFADLAGLLAALGLAYGSPEARGVGAAIAALTRGAAEAESGRIAARLGAREPVCLIAPAPPAETIVPGLAAAARAALAEAAGAPGLRHIGLVALAPADAVELLLGAESGGVAPAPAASRLALDAEGWVAEVPTRAAQRVGREAAARLLAPVPDSAWLAMVQAVAPYLHAAPPLPLAAAAPARAPAPPPTPAALPSRANGLALRVAIGGARVALRTTEDAEGRPVEVLLTAAREAPALRALLDSTLAAVSAGLARGVPLDAYVEIFLHSRFGMGGTVEGDPAIRRATSVLDWAFRALAREYLNRRDLPDPAADPLPEPALTAPPLLPLDLPLDQPSPRPRRGKLRLVG